MAHIKGACFAKPVDLSLTPRIHPPGGRRELTPKTCPPTYRHCGLCIVTHGHTYK